MLVLGKEGKVVYVVVFYAYFAKKFIFAGKNHVFVILCSPIRERGVEKMSFYRKKHVFYQNIDFSLQIPFRDAGVLDFRSKNVHFS